MPAWVNKLMERWGLESPWQVLVVLVVFSVTGSTAAYASKIVLPLVGITEATAAYIHIPVYILLIFPLYQVLLLAFGFLFGQFQFFYQFERKMWARMGLVKRRS